MNKTNAISYQHIYICIYTHVVQQWIIHNDLVWQMRRLRIPRQRLSQRLCRRCPRPWPIRWRPEQWSLRFFGPERSMKFERAQKTNNKSKQNQTKPNKQANKQTNKQTNNQPTNQPTKQQQKEKTYHMAIPKNQANFATLKSQVSQRVEIAALARKQLKGPLEFRVPWWSQWRFEICTYSLVMLIYLNMFVYINTCVCV